MPILRLYSCVFLGLLLCCATQLAHASLYASQPLSEAERLLEISPVQARQLAQEYLTQRKLSEQAERSPSSISRDENDIRIRTPGSTVEALKILAQAEFSLGNPEHAFAWLTQALAMSEQYQLLYLALDSAILETQFRWLMDHNATQARESLRAIMQDYQQLAPSVRLLERAQYKITLLRAAIAAKAQDNDLAKRLFLEAQRYVEGLSSVNDHIDFLLVLGEYHLQQKEYHLALSALLNAYWQAIDTNASTPLAKANLLLGQLFYEQKVYEKALVHLSQAADFYDDYQQSPLLAQALQAMGDIYYQQQKYNLAIVYYFNTIDHESHSYYLDHIIKVRLKLARTYLMLHNTELAAQYLAIAQSLLEEHPFPELEPSFYVLMGQLRFQQQQTPQALSYAQQALMQAQPFNLIDIQAQANQLLVELYLLRAQPQLALNYARQNSQLLQQQQQIKDEINANSFRQQKEFVEQSLHLVGQEKTLQQTQQEYRQLKQFSWIVFVITLITGFMTLRRGYLVQHQKTELQTLNQQLYTHSRSQLRNLRTLNTQFINSLARQEEGTQNWEISDLISQPLNDRLRFAMIDVPFLRNMYLQHGYRAGLEFEQALGAFLKSVLPPKAQLYHFSDANLLYIEPCSDRNTPPEQLFSQIQQWVFTFQPERKLNRVVRVGIVDYPFLPRAYTAINDMQLLDIVLMAACLARDLSTQENMSHWVYFKAIDNAPAASFVHHNMRHACYQAIQQGLIKVYSSCQNEELLKLLLQENEEA